MWSHKTKFQMQTLMLIQTKQFLLRLFGLPGCQQDGNLKNCRYQFCESVLFRRIAANIIYTSMTIRGCWKITINLLTASEHSTPISWFTVLCTKLYSLYAGQKGRHNLNVQKEIRCLRAFYLCLYTMSYISAIISYYGRHGSKQFIKGKPVRFGFKLVIADSSGYVYHAEPYCGASTRIEDRFRTGTNQSG